MPRGGKRQGRPGASYGNRTDLQMGARPLAPTTVPSTGYGNAAAQTRSQQAVPMGPPPTSGPPLGVGGSVTPLDAPTERPLEPLTAGAPFGPGPGPEALGMPGPQDPNGPDPDLAALSSYLPMLERLASLPNSTVATRNLVRRLRGGMP